MPIYEYRCQACGHEMEALVRGGKEPNACPSCGTESLTRKISRAGVIFKGSGFYVNDSRGSSSGGGSKSSSSSPSTSSDSGSSSSSSSSDSSSSGSKSETSASSSSKSSD